MPRKPIPFSVRFWAKVDRRSSGECWPWIGAGAGSRQGYGTIRRGSASQGMVRAHRASWEIHRGPIPAGTLVLHRCDNPPCVNPGHLFLGTDADNVRDMVSKGRLVTKRGEDHVNAKLTADDVVAARRAHAAGRASIRDLAIRLGVSRAAVRLAVNRKTWGHVP